MRTRRFRRWSGRSTRARARRSRSASPDPPGVGKSSIIAKLIRLYRDEGKKVGVVSVDPSSPFTKGAILGDRIRLADHFLDKDVFIRSMGSRGHLGGLAGSSRLAAMAMEAYGMDVVLYETVGVGQGEVEVEPGGDGGLGIVGETDLGEEILYLAAEPDRLYAATPSKLVALDLATLEIIRSVELSVGGGESTGASTEGSEPSGIAVGEEGVFLTLAGEPCVLLVAKPPTEE